MKNNPQYPKKRNPNFRQTLYTKVNALAQNCGHIYTYMKLKERKEGEYTELDENAIYRVLYQIVSPTVTLIALQNIFTGIILDTEYDLDLFVPLHGHSGYSDKLPEIGKDYTIFEYDTATNKHFETKVENILWIEHISERLWNVLTAHDVYSIILNSSYLK